MLLHATRSMPGISKAAALAHPAAWLQNSATQDIEQAEHLDKLGPLRTSLPSTARKVDAHTPTSPPGAELIQVVIAGSAEEDPSRLFSPAARTHSEASTAETIHRVWPQIQRLQQRQHEGSLGTGPPVHAACVPSLLASKQACLLSANSCSQKLVGCYAMACPGCLACTCQQMLATQHQSGLLSCLLS